LKTAAAKKVSSGRMLETADGEESTPARILKHVPGMFAGPAGLASNWKMGSTSLVNGAGYNIPIVTQGVPRPTKA
jgi:hypothetical protein